MNGPKPVLDRKFDSALVFQKKHFAVSILLKCIVTTCKLAKHLVDGFMLIMMHCSDIRSMLTGMFIGPCTVVTGRDTSTS